MIERVDLRLIAEGLDWVIVGAESGPNRRPCKIAWIRDVVQQCQAAGVPVFIKQMEVGGKIVKKPFLDGRQWLELPDARRGDE
jgi:protein gp37